MTTAMVNQSGSVRFWQKVGQVPGRVPLRIKLITAVLALVAIALVAISVAGLSFLRGYLLSPVDTALIASQNLAQHDVAGCLTDPSSCPQPAMGGAVLDWLPAHGRPVSVLVPVQPRFGSLHSQPTTVIPGPATSAERSLTGLTGHPVTVPAQSGGGRWRVIAFPASYSTVSGQTVTGTIIVGVDVSSAYRTIGELARIDLIVSGIVLVALAVAGVAIVRTSLRPLTDIELTAEAIAAGDLSQRVPDRDPRTEVGRLGRSLNAMLAQIEAAFHAREESEAAARRSEERIRRFVADASHELRTPLTAIRGYAEYYRQRAGRAGSGGVRARSGAVGASAGGGAGELDLDRIMQRVEQESARMGLLVEDMLLLARLDQQRPLDMGTVDMLEIARDTVNDTRVLAPDREVTLTVATTTAPLVRGDGTRLRQVMGNLISNALTHTPGGTPIEVTIRSGQPPRREDAAKAARAMVIVEVTDHGPGLEPEQAEHVFERFYRADRARTRKGAGGAGGSTGLGLAIVAALVAAHEGTVWVDSKPGAGATFGLALPPAPEGQ